MTRAAKAKGAQRRSEPHHHEKESSEDHLLQRFVVAFLVVAVSLFAGGCKTAAEPDSSERLTLLTLNLRGVMDVPCDSPAGNWKFRYTNVGTGLKAGGVVPDVIALQEVNGWTWCTFDARMIPDYAPLEELLTSLEAGTGVQYRIAYLNALTWVQGNFHCTVMGTPVSTCQAMSGLALLYNPRRIRNLMADTSVSDAAQALSHDAPYKTGAHLRRSLPCCNPAAGFMVLSRIDGPVQTDKCNRDTPAALAWITGTEGALARLELVDRPGASFHVYNVHLSWQSNLHPSHVSTVNAAVDALELRFGTSRWIPPIMMGDFNNKSDSATLGDFPRFQYRGSAAEDDWILSGNPVSFPASARITGYVSTEMPRVPPSQGGCHGPDVLWSDHCAVLTTLTIE